MSLKSIFKYYRSLQRKLKNNHMNQLQIIDEPESLILALAINHYLPTSDHIGVFLWVESPCGQLRVLVPVNRAVEADLEGHRLLVERLSLLRKYLVRLKIAVSMELCEELQTTEFHTYFLGIPRELKAKSMLAGLLVTPFLPVEWGYSKPYVDTFCRTFPAVAVTLRRAQSDASHALAAIAAGN